MVELIAVGATARDKNLGRAEAMRCSMLAIIDTGERRQAHPGQRARFGAVDGHAPRSNVRCGSKSEETAAPANVRLTAMNGHRASVPALISKEPCALFSMKRLSWRWFNGDVQMLPACQN
jgi:hypothetical protein